MAVRGIWVPVYPSMQNFGATVVQEASGAARRGSSAMQQEFRRGGRAAGEAAGQSTAAGLRAQQGQIERVSRQLAGARSAEADAAGSVRVAEAKLQETRNNGNSTAAQIAAAEEAVNRARRTHETRITAVQTAERDLEAVREGGVSSSRQVVRAEQQLQAARNKVDDANGQIRVAEAKLTELRNSGTASSDKIAAAEEKLERARRQLRGAADEVTTSQLRLTNAQQQAEQATEENTDAVEEQNRQFGISMETAAKWGAAVGAVAVAVGTALFQVGSQFDDMGDALRLTGANGAQLDALNQSAMNVAQTTPALDGGLEQIGETMATLHQRLGLTGQPLETLTSQMVQLANMGQEVDLNEVTGAMTAFGIKGEDTSATLDRLFQVSQRTGLTVSELATSVSKGGPALRQFGLGIGESAALIGTLDRAGLDADKTMAAMTKGLSVFAKEGKKPKEALMETITGIKDFVSAGNDPQAIAMASKIFGTKGAAQFVDAVKSGAVSVESLNAAMAGGGDTILGAADDTADFAEQWQLFKQKALVAIEPLATKVFGVISQGMGFIAEKGIPTISSVTEFVGKFKWAFVGLAAAIGTFVIPALVQYTIAQAKAVAGSIWSSITKIAGAWRTMGTALKSSAIAQRAMNSAILTNPITWIVVALVAAGVALWAFFTKTETGRKLWAKIWGGIKTAVSAVVDWFVNTAWPFMQGVFQKIGDIAMWLWHNVMEPVWTGIKAVIDAWWFGVQVYWTFIQIAWRAIALVAMWLWNSVFVPVFNGIRAVVALWWAGVQVYWSLIQVAWRAVAAVAMWLWCNVMVPVWNGIKAAISAAWHGVIKPIWDAIVTTIDWIGEKANWLWQNVMVPVWEGIKNAISSVWNFLKPIFDKIGDAMKTVGEIGKQVGSTMKSAFDGVVGVIKAPIHAIGRLLASIPTSILGVDIPGADRIKSWGQTLQSLRTGGTIAGRTDDGRFTGPGSGVSDSIWGVDASGLPIVRVSAGEGVVNYDAMQNGGARIVAALNAGWRPSGLQGLAAGGVVGEDTYGLPTGTNTGGYGSAYSGWPQWVKDLQSKFNVKPSTYPGHQESDRNEAGYAPNPQHLNRGIDWVGSVADMQKFAEWLISIAPNTKALEQVIFQNPSTGTKFGWAGRSPDTNGSYFASDYGGHQDHVHIRASGAIREAVAQPATVDPAAVVPGDTTTTPPAATDTPSATTTGATDPSSTKGQEDRLPTMGELAGKVATSAVDDVADFFGFKDTWLYDPNKLGISTQKDKGDKTAPTTTTDPADPSAPPAATPTDPAAPQRDQIQKVAPGTVSQGPAYPKGDSAFIVKETSIAAAERDLGEKGATIGVATNLVEVGDPPKVYANNQVPESLQFPHDAVGSDHDSIGTFQQRQAGWGTVAQRMNPRGAASMFFNAMLKKFPNWQTMDPGAVAQGVQVSAFPDKYGTKMGRAAELVRQSGVFDRGGVATGIGFMRKDILEPERTLSPRETDLFEEMVAANFRPSNGSDVAVAVPGLGDDESSTAGKREGREAPLVGQLTVQAIDVDDQVRRINRTLRDVAKSDTMLGGWS